MKNIRSIARIGVLAAAAGLLPACSVLPPGQTVDVYRLPSHSTGDANQTPAGTVVAGGAPAARHTAVLRVASLESGVALDSAKIVVIPDGDVLSSYRGARWSDPAPELMRTRLVQAFTADNRIIALKDNNSSVHADLELGGELEAFQIEYRDGKPVVRVRFDVTLVDISGRRVIAVHRFEVLDTPPTSDVPAIVKAFGRATDALSSQVVDWALHAATPT